MGTRTVTGIIYHLDGTAWAAGEIKFTLLEAFETSTETYPRETHTETLDANGQFSIALGVPDSGTAHYQVELPDKKAYEFFIAAGAATTLETILTIAGSPVDQDAVQTLIDAHAAQTNVHSIGRPATFVIAASNASILSKAQADYLCDGTDDQVQIQAAINALPSVGGQITLTEGLFTLADSGSGYCINIVKDNVILGIPIGATLKLKNNEISGAEICNLIKIGNGTTVFSNILLYGGGIIDGNEDNNSSTGSITTGADIFISGPVSNVRLLNLSMNNASRDAIFIYGKDTNNRANNIKIEACVINNPAEGIVWGNADEVWVRCSEVKNTREQDGIESLDNCDGWWIEDNYLEGINAYNSAIDIFSNTTLNTNGIVRGNRIKGAANAYGDIVVGLGASGPISNILIQGNIITNGWMCMATGAGGVNGIRIEGNIIEGALNKYGIWLDAYASGVSIIGNDIHDCGYSGIQVLSSNVEIRNNRVYNNGKTVAGAATDRAGIKAVNQTATVIIGNYIYDNQAEHTQYYGVHIGGSINAIVTDNYLGDSIGQAVYVNGSTAPTVQGNGGFKTENSGIIELADGGTITHGLIHWPGYVILTPMIAGEMASVTEWDANHFHVAIKKHDGSPGTTQYINWSAAVLRPPDA